MEAKLKKEKGNEAVRQFRIRQKEKELADKERAEMLRKENMEMEIRVASYQQVREIFFFSVLDLNQFLSEEGSHKKTTSFLSQMIDLRWLNSGSGDGWRYQNGWIFGKVPNGLWPPPLIFGKSCCNLFQEKPCFKVQDLQHKFLDWKWHPPFSSVLVASPVLKSALLTQFSLNHQTEFLLKFLLLIMHIHLMTQLKLDRQKWQKNLWDKFQRQCIMNGVI